MPVNLDAQKKISARSADVAHDKTEAPSFNIRGNNGYLEGIVPGCSTAEELMAFMKVDPKEWTIDRQKIGMHEMGFKKSTVRSATGKDGSSRKDSISSTQPLYSIQVWLKRRVREKMIRAIFADMLAAFKVAKPLSYKLPKSSNSGLALEVDIFDHHFGKLAWKKESGESYDLEIAAERYREALVGLLDRAKGFDISKIVFPVGNDYFHSDSDKNTTTAGTFVDCDGRWQKSFVEGRKAMVEAILKLAELAPVEVITIPGNHDERNVFFLGEILTGIFSGNKHVKIDNEPKMRKYWHYGHNLVSFTHGNNEKMQNLPLLMAQEVPELWAKSKFREAHVGHFHKLQEISFKATDEFNSIRVRVLSSLCGPDSWHKRMGYTGLKSSNAFVWDKEEGLIANLSYQVK